MNEKHKHTPGPWRVSTIGTTNSGGVPVVSDDCRICVVDKTYGGWRDSNARLIAAAPDMLEALDELVLALENIRGIDFLSYAPDEINNARAAIAKATGGAK